jgi:hypothetical protein
MIKSVTESYQRKLTALAMKALMTMPTVSNDPKVAGFYFNTDAWDADKKIIPYSDRAVA